ncbi:MAG: response regulator transcription factor [Thermoanaerobaculaceae bacterium]|jgi:DNA-binding NarL/FixJ family response regulator|nr:response regulator transcription factor [Thermoanaerobaculaceae bacterium]
MSTTRRPTVLLADDHRMMVEGLRVLLAAEFDLVGVVEDGIALVEAARTLQPDVVVADIAMPRLNGIDALTQLRRDNKRVRVVFLTMHQDIAYARRALDAGAAGYVLKHSAPAELCAAIHAALEGRIFVTPTLAGDLLQKRFRERGTGGDALAMITPRQREVLQLLAEGCSAKQVAARLAISSRTVEFHKYQMMELLGVRTNGELIHFAIKHGLVAI